MIDYFNEVVKLQSENYELKEACKKSQECVFDNQHTIAELKAENGKLRKELRVWKLRRRMERKIYEIKRRTRIPPRNSTSD